MDKLKTLLSKRLGILVALVVVFFIIVMKVLDVAEGVLENKFVLGSLIWGVVILGSVWMLCETKRPTGKKDE